MTKFIRWWGFIGFAVVSGLIFGGWFLFAGTLAKLTVEKSATSMLSVPVTVESASFTLDPLGFRFNQLQIPDKDRLDYNEVVIESAVAEVDFWKMVRGKIIINDLLVTGMVFDQPRSSPWEVLPQTIGKDTTGGVQGAENTEEEPSALQNSLQSLPSVSEVLGRESLKTRAQGEQLKETVASAKQELSAKAKAVPSNADLKQYQQRLTDLTKGDFKDLDDFKKRKAELDKIKADLAKDKQALTALQTAVKENSQQINQDVSALKSAPGEDLNNLKDKYQLNQEGLLNLTQLLFGEQIRDYSETALTWYERIKPFIPEGGEEEVEPERTEGRFIPFPTNKPDPDFWLKRAALDAQSGNKILAISLTDATSHFDAVKKPAVLEVLSGAQEAFKLDGQLQPGLQDYQLNWRGLAVKGAKLIDSDDLSVALKQSKVSIAGKSQVKKGVIDLVLDANFSGATFATQGQGLLATELNAALASIQQFKVTAKATGKLQNLKLSVSSDLDKKVSGEFKKSIAAKQKQFQQELESKLKAEAETLLAPARQELARLDKQKTALQNQAKELESMLATQLEDFAAQQKAKLDAEKAAAEAAAKAKAEELKRKAEAEKARLEAEKRKAEEEAKKKAEEELKNKLKDKLKLPGS